MFLSSFGYCRCNCQQETWGECLCVLAISLLRFQTNCKLILFFAKDDFRINLFNLKSRISFVLIYRNYKGKYFESCCRIFDLYYRKLCTIFLLPRLSLVPLYPFIYSANRNICRLIYRYLLYCLRALYVTDFDI